LGLAPHSNADDSRCPSQPLSLTEPVSNVRQALGAFEWDAHARTPLTRADPERGNTLRLSDQQVADIHEVLQRHPIINTPDFVLPGTLSV